MTNLTRPSLQRHVIAASAGHTEKTARVAGITSVDYAGMIELMLCPHSGAGVAALAHQIGRYVIATLATHAEKTTGMTLIAPIDHTNVIKLVLCPHIG